MTLYILASFLIFWNPSPADSFTVYRDGARLASTPDTFYTDAVEIPGTHEYRVSAIGPGGESGRSVAVTGTLQVLTDSDLTFAATLSRTERAVTVVVLPVPEAAWIIGDGLIVCRADYDGNDAVTLPDLAAFGIYSGANAYQADLNGDGEVNLSDFAGMGNLYQWRIQ